MTEAAKILLAHHLKTLKLLTLPHGNTTSSPGPAADAANTEVCAHPHTAQPKARTTPGS